LKAKTKAVLALIFLLFISVGSVFAAYQAGFLSFTPAPQTLVNISQVYVDPQGQNVGGQWKGSFWNLNVQVTADDQASGVILPKDQSSSINYQGTVKALKTGAKVELRIQPNQPYIVRNIVEKTAQVTSDAFETIANKGAPFGYSENTNVKAGALWMNYYDWAEPSFRIYTPFTVTILKDGVQVGQATFNNQGSNGVQTIDTGEGTVRIENLGILSGNYMTPSVPAQIAILKGYPNIYDWTQIQNLVRNDLPANYNPVSQVVGGSIQTNPWLVQLAAGSNAYSTYWYGQPYRWKSDNSPAAFQSVGSVIGTNIGGWSSSDTSSSYLRDPVAPVVGLQDKGTLPADKRSYMSVTEYIENKGVSNLAATLFSQFQKATIQTDSSTGNKQLRLDVPWGAYGTSSVNIRVPTELADTFVDQPSIGNVQPTAHWQTTGNKYASTTGHLALLVDLAQSGTVTSTTTVKVTCGSSNVGVFPTQQVMTVPVGTPTQVSFDISNLGVLNQETNVALTVTCIDQYTGSTTGTDTAYMTLESTLSHENTLLKIHVVSEADQTPITGLPINVVFGSQEDPGYSDTNGQYVTTLQTTGGGAYQGPVQISTQETATFQSTSTSVTVPDTKEITIQVPLQGAIKETGITLIEWIMIAAIIILIIAVAAIVIYHKMR
jgi:hypothetical protein